MGRKIRVSAPGKIILSGEHSVVYGQPAIVTAIDKRLLVEIEKGRGKTEVVSDEKPDLAHYALLKTEEFLKEKLPVLRIKIHSEIPVNRGLGSSAALSVAMVAALFCWIGERFDKNLINKIAYEIEKKPHGQPSGCDNSIATFGGMILFRKSKIKSLEIKPSFSFFLIDSGRAAESTKEMVMIVRERSKNLRIKKVIKQMREVTVLLIKELKKSNFNYLSSLIFKNEQLLEELGVVSKQAQKIIRGVEKIGGAAKICGAGGFKKGSGIILAFNKDQRKLRKFLQEQKLLFFKTKINQTGVSIEKN